jgi:WD40 repeat protein
VPTRRVRVVLQGRLSGFLSVDFAPDGRMLASATGHFQNQQAGEVRLWDAATGQQRLVLQGHPTGAWCVRFAPDGRTLASVGDDGSVRLWSTAAR